MKKYSLFLVSLFFVFSLQAAVFHPNSTTPASVSTAPAPAPSLSADNLMVPLFNSGKSVSLSDFMHMNASKYKTLTGERMSFKERIELKLFQHRFKNAFAKDGTIDLQKFHQDMDDDGGFHLGWFLLGFLLGLIGLIIALCINDDNRHGRIKWTLIGWASFVAIYLIAIVI
jgi:hypothetical protein